MSFGLSACGGGGGGGSAVTPASNPSPSSTSSNNPASSFCSLTSAAFTANVPTGTAPTNSVYTVTSNPTGLAVTLDGVSQGNTPANNVNPGLSNSPHTIIVDPGVGNYQVQIAQTQNGPHSIFYNKLADTSGTVTNLSSVARSAQSETSSQAASMVSRMPRPLAGLPGVSQNMLYVHYSVSRLRAAGKQASGIEQAVGVTAALQIGAPSGDDQLRAVAIPSGRSIDAVAGQLRAQSGVTNVEAVHLRYTAASTPISPNDTHYASQQWDMAQIGAPNAWGYGVTAGSVKVAIIDTGYDCAHLNSTDDLTQNVAFQASIINGTANTAAGAALDSDGHGTNVAGIADAVTNNGAGFAGVAFNAAQLFIYRIFPPGVDQSANTADEAAAIEDAIGRGVKVINLSLGGPQSSGADAGEQKAMSDAISAGVTIVAAAGNDTASAVDFPGAYSGVISVGATSLADGQPNGAGNSSASGEYIASYSNYGQGLGLVAPGGDPCCNGVDSDNNHWITNLYSTGDTTPGQTCNPSGQSDKVCAAKFAGTSQATPHVTGAAALMLAKNGALTPAQIAQVLESSADDICGGASPCVTKEGHGRLNVYRALASVTGDASPPGYTPVKNQLIAFAYTVPLTVGSVTGVGGTQIINVAAGTSSVILDKTYLLGVPVSSTGTFHIGDLPTTVGGGWKIGVWYNAAGNGILSAGDRFGVVNTCAGQLPCAAGSITVTAVTATQTF